MSFTDELRNLEAELEKTKLDKKYNKIDNIRWFQGKILPMMKEFYLFTREIGWQEKVQGSNDSDYEYHFNRKSSTNSPLVLQIIWLDPVENYVLRYFNEAGTPVGAMAFNMNGFDEILFRHTLLAFRKLMKD